MVEHAIEVRDLRIDYGDFNAVQSLAIRIPRGSVYGLVGPNGAGKTSIIRALAGLLEPTYGDIWIEGIDLAEDPRRAFARMGYMPDLAPVIPDLTVVEFLRFYAGMYGMDPASHDARVDEVLAEVKMESARDKLCHTLSRGMTQRVVLAKTLLHRPTLLLLDEPASGMDPIARLDLRATLQGIASNGGTVLISSHILSELTDMCTHMAILHRGELRMTGRVDSILNQVQSPGRTIRLETPDDPESLVGFLHQQPSVSQVSAEERMVQCHFEGNEHGMAALLAGVVRAGINLHRFEPRKSGLEDILRGLSDGDDEKEPAK